MESMYDELKEESETARKGRCELDGVSYEPAIGMNGGYTEEEIAAAGDANEDEDRKPAAKGRTKSKQCSACGGWDHSRLASKRRAKHLEWARSKGKKPAAATSTQQALTERDANELEGMDALPFSDAVDDDGMEFFYDALESDEDVQLMQATI